MLVLYCFTKLNRFIASILRTLLLLSIFKEFRKFVLHVFEFQFLPLLNNHTSPRKPIFSFFYFFLTLFTSQNSK